MLNQNLLPIIGIDLGLNKNVVCLFRPELRELQFRTIPTSGDEGDIIDFWTALHGLEPYPKTGSEKRNG